MGNNKPKAFKISIQALKRIQYTNILYIYRYTLGRFKMIISYK